MTFSRIKKALFIARVFLLLIIISAITVNSAVKSEIKDSAAEKIIIEQTADGLSGSILIKINPAVISGVKFTYNCPDKIKPVFYYTLSLIRCESYRFPLWSRSTFT